MDVFQSLKVFDDSKFKFNHKYHSYTYDSKPLQSVTKWISRFEVPFDSDAISKKVADKIGQDQSDILETWKQKNEKAKSIGHQVHSYIEDYYNGTYQKLPIDIDIIKRINSFNVAWSKWLHKLEPICFEKRIFHNTWGIAGTLDALFKYGDKYIILDYKSNEEFKDDTHPKGCYNRLLQPFENYWQNSFNTYSIQVSLYSLILREMAGIDIHRCLLLHLGLEGPRIYTAHDLREQLFNYFPD